VRQTRGAASRRPIELYTIDHNLRAPHMFAVAGTGPRAWVYDARTLSISQDVDATRSGVRPPAMHIHTHADAYIHPLTHSLTRSLSLSRACARAYSICSPSLPATTYGLAELEEQPHMHITSVCFGAVRGRCPCATASACA
jgi:hypothetical protein